MKNKKQKKKYSDYSTIMLLNSHQLHEEYTRIISTYYTIKTTSCPYPPHLHWKTL